MWGVPEQEVGDDGLEGSALVEWSYTDLPAEPVESVAPGARELIEGTAYDDGRNLDPHECPRREPEAQDQLWTFLSTGRVVQTCGGEGCLGSVAERCP